jgi:uncharacterized protein (DUF433 family)
MAPADEELIKPGDPRYGLIWQNPARVSGTPCFHGTRVPVNILFDHLAAGDTLEKFLSDFEGVTREQAIAVSRLVARDSRRPGEATEIRPDLQTPCSRRWAW